MKSLLLSLAMLGALLLPQFSHGQCQPDPTVPSVPGVYPDSLEVDGCQYIEEVVTFILPRDSSASLGGVNVTANFIAFTIDSISGLPDGVDWECNLSPGCRYVVHKDSMNVDTLGCITFFGTPSVPAFYNVTVNLTSEFVLFGQTNVQPFNLSAPLRVRPCAFTGDCYTLNLNSNCEPSILSIENEVPSNGDPRYSYDWRIESNNGFSFTSNAENPADQLLSEAGDYFIEYNAAIDTVGYFLTNARIDQVDCSDLFDGADLYWYLIAPNGDTLVNTSASPLSNSGNNLPVFTGVSSGILDSGNYEMQVWDDDTFGDQGCSANGASVNFSIPPSSEDSLTVSNGGLSLTFFFDHPIQQINCTDTLSIFSTPEAPEVLANSDTLQFSRIEWCSTEALSLTGVGDSVEWFQDGIKLNSPDGSIVVEEEGSYEAIAVNPNSFCRSSISTVDVVEIEVRAPAVVAVGDTIYVGSPRPNLVYDWYDLSGNLLGQGDKFSPESSGDYYATATDNALGCTSRGSDTLVLRLTSLENSLSRNIHLYPNPARDYVELDMSLEKSQETRIHLLDLFGRKLKTWEKYSRAGEEKHRLELQGLSPGIYLFQVQVAEGSWTKKFVIE